MKDTTYRLIAWLFDVCLWGGELVDGENLPESGPAVFVSNHLGASGPIAVVASLPVRVYPWVIAEMMDRELAAEYLRQDFVEPQLHVPPRFSPGLAKAISRVSVRLLASAGGIPVFQGERLPETYRLSVDLLAEGKSLLIFPEDPKQGMDPRYRMTPFKKGFARLGEFFHERTGQSLRFYPLAVHQETYQVRAGKPVVFNPLNNPANERLRIKSRLETSIHEMYLSMAQNGYIGIPLPH
ncbi:MAG: hypothetical protein AB1846_11100 [Chloroflexota bacterium]